MADLNVVMKGRFFIDKFITDRKGSSLQEKITATKIAIMNVSDIYDAVKGVIEATGIYDESSAGTKVSRVALAELKHWEEVVKWLKEEYFLISGQNIK